MEWLRNALQSASNAVAGNVAGPVDLLTLALQKVGVPVPDNAVGSTQWMRDQGLYKDVPMGADRIAGETAGLLSPIAAAAKAPQIAKGLLQAGDNLAAPRTLNPQTGAIVWHGSPHKFDRFDSSKIGTGEGAQAYGHGLYLAESPDVARTYLGTGKAKLGPASEARLAATMERAQDAGRYGEALALEELLINRSPARAISRFSDQSGGKQYKDALEAVQKYARYFDEGGSLYKVDLPDTAIARMLDWDKPLSQQAEGVLSGLERAGVMDYARQYFSANRKADPTGADLHDFLKYSGYSQNEVPAKFAEQGIPGIRYLDGGSRGAGSGTRNYVVFPGEEEMLRILERNGQPVGLLNY